MFQQHYNAGNFKKIQQQRKKIKKRKRERLLFPYVLLMSINAAFMKTTTKTSFDELFSNPITRNLILILVATMTLAIVLVTASIIIYNQF